MLLFVLLFGLAPLARGQNPPQDKLCRLCHDVATSKSAPSPATAGGQPRAHAKVGCVDCHVALKTFDASAGEDHATPLEKVACGTCHEKQQSALALSVHGHASVGCASCHEPHAIGQDPSTGASAVGAARPESCARCHEQAAQGWARSVHAGDPGNGHVAARCTDCHGAHDVRGAKDPESRVYPLRLPDTCESCHHTDPSPEHPAPAGEKVEQYKTSAHGVGLRKDGLLVTATCASCHGAHEIRKPSEATAPTARAQIPYTCGACHAGILAEYLQGVHGEAFKAGVKDVPVCNDCHREHAAKGPDQGSSSVAAGVVAETCARCHANDDLSKRYGFRGSARTSWGSSYHGIASSFGASNAANCASCHGFHAILPSQDPRSPVNPENLDETCGRCHVGSGLAFARVPVHSVIERESNFVPWAVKTVYAVLVVGLIGAFALFILLDLFARLRLRMGWGPLETEHVDPAQWPDESRLVPPGETFKRMGYHGRLQHVVLMLSFLLLVVTGIPVFLHDSDWMRSVIDLEGGFALRSRLHRVAAIALVGLSLWHLATLLLMPSVRQWFRGMLIRPADVRDFAQEMMFDLGLLAWLSRRRLFRPLFDRWPWLCCDRRPRIGRYGLVEKLEYGAVLWGNLVMILTGSILWRPDWFLDWMPEWTFDVCRVVHGFEATLAFLAIIIWHMYHVHLRPGVFPMSRVWINGRISREELRHHHPAEYLRILEHRRAERSVGGPPPETVR